MTRGWRNYYEVPWRRTKAVKDTMLLTNITGWKSLGFTIIGVSQLGSFILNHHKVIRTLCDSVLYVWYKCTGLFRTLKNPYHHSLQYNSLKCPKPLSKYECSGFQVNKNVVLVVWLPFFLICPYAKSLEEMQWDTQCQCFQTSLFEPSL